MDSRTPDPMRFAEAKGREIEGLPSREERFTRLTEGLDFSVVRENAQVDSTRDVREFALFVNPKKGRERLLVHAPHWRSVTVPDGSFALRSRRAKEGIMSHYYDVNVKGSGFLKPTLEGGNLDEYPSLTVAKVNGDHELRMALGLAQLKDFERGDGVITESQYLAELGLRSELYWGVIRLDRIPFRGELSNVESLAQQGVIPDGWEYAQAVRLFRTNTRIEEASESSVRRQQIFKDAFATFNKETRDDGLSFPVLDIKKKEHQAIWFSEFFRRMGGNLAILINAGLSHSHLHASNVTMAAEIADLESLWDLRRPVSAFHEEHGGTVGGVDRLVLKDMRDATFSSRALVRAGRVAGLSAGEPTALAKSMREGFEERFRPGALRGPGIPVNPNSAIYWLHEITEKMIVNNERLVSLLKGDVTDWGIAIPEDR